MEKQGGESLKDRNLQWLDEHATLGDILETLFEILFETLDAVF